MTRPPEVPEAGTDSAALFWDGGQDFPDDFLPLEDLPLESVGSAVGEQESVCPEKGLALEEAIPREEDAEAAQEREGFPAEWEASSDEEEVQIEAENQTGGDTCETLFEESAPFVLELEETFAWRGADEEEFVPAALSPEAHEEAPPELRSGKGPEEVAGERALPIENGEEMPSVAGMRAEGVAGAEDTAAVETREPEPAILEVVCPACKQALILRREFLGVEGACVWCQTPVVAVAYGLTGEVKVFRIAVEPPEPETAPPAASTGTGEDRGKADEAHAAPPGPSAEESGLAKFKEEPAKPEPPQMPQTRESLQKAVHSPRIGEEKPRSSSREGVREAPPRRTRPAPPPRKLAEPGGKLRKSPLDAIRGTGATLAFRAETESRGCPPPETGGSQAVTEEEIFIDAPTSMAPDMPEPKSAEPVDPVALLSPKSGTGFEFESLPLPRIPGGLSHHSEFPGDALFPDDFDDFFSPPDTGSNPFQDRSGPGDPAWESSGIPPMRKAGDSLPAPRVSIDSFSPEPEDWQEKLGSRIASPFPSPVQAPENPFSDSGFFCGSGQKPEDPIFFPQSGFSGSSNPSGRMDAGFGRETESTFPPGPGFFSGPASSPVRNSPRKSEPGKIAGLLLGVFGLVFGVGAASFFWSDIIETFQSAVTDKIEMTGGTDWPESQNFENSSKNQTDSTVAEGKLSSQLPVDKSVQLPPDHPGTP